MVKVRERLAPGRDLSNCDFDFPVLVESDLRIIQLDDFRALGADDQRIARLCHNPWEEIEPRIRLRIKLACRFDPKWMKKSPDFPTLLYDIAGLTQTEIGSRCNRSQVWIHQRLKRWGIKGRSPAVRFQDEEVLVRARHQEYSSDEEAGASLGVSEAWFLRARKRHHVPPKEGPFGIDKQKLSPKMVDEIYLLYRQGLSIRGVVRRYGKRGVKTSYETVRQAIKQKERELGIKIIRPRVKALQDYFTSRRLASSTK